MFVFWQGRGWLIPVIAAAAMFLPIVVLGQIDGPAIDRGVAVTATVAAAATFWLGLRWNRGAGPAQHSFWAVPFQVWAAPMLLFAVLLGTGTITTAEEPPRPRAVRPVDGGLK